MKVQGREVPFVVIAGARTGSVVHFCGRDFALQADGRWVSRAYRPGMTQIVLVPDENGRIFRTEFVILSGMNTFINDNGVLRPAFRNEI